MYVIIYISLSKVYITPFFYIDSSNRKGDSSNRKGDS